jgi:hypothetical protein
MARPLRIELAGAWYHVMNRGHRGGTLFRDDADRRRFLGLVAELPERFSLEVHAFVLIFGKASKGHILQFNNWRTVRRLRAPRDTPSTLAPDLSRDATHSCTRFAKAPPRRWPCGPGG